jgi:hypothetical protein
MPVQFSEFEIHAEACPKIGPLWDIAQVNRKLRRYSAIREEGFFSFCPETSAPRDDTESRIHLYSRCF